MPILETRQLVKVYGEKKGMTLTYALGGVDMSVEKGEFVGVMGPSGSGKSTLLNLLGSIDKPTSGSILLGDRKVEHLKKKELAGFRRREIGFIFQDYNLVDSLTVAENVMLPLVLDRQKPDVMEAKADKILSFLGLEEKKGAYPYHLSGGQQQRVAAARALISEPRIILADEPTGNLDSKGTKNLMGNLLQMNQERCATILMVTHDPLVASYCNRILFLYDGAVAMEIRKKESENFYDRILESLAVLEGSEIR